MSPIITNVDQKALRTTKFPPEFSQKVDTTKINVAVIKNWADGELSKILGFEDDVVSGLLFDLLESNKNPDIKGLQLQLGGFLGTDAPNFCKTLWNLCLSAQDNPTGVPQQLLEAKKAELIQERQVQEQAAEQARRRRQFDDNRDREIDELRHRDRRDRDSYRDRRGGRGNDRWQTSRREFSRSPPRRRGPPPRDFGRRPPPRGTDSYTPAGQSNYGRSRSPPSFRAARRLSRSRSRNRADSRDRYDNRDARTGDKRGRHDSPPRRRRSSSPRPRRSQSPNMNTRKYRRRDDSASRSRSRSLLPRPRARNTEDMGRKAYREDQSSSPQTQHKPADKRDRTRRPSRSISVDSRDADSRAGGSRSRSPRRPTRFQRSESSSSRSPAGNGRSSRKHDDTETTPFPRSVVDRRGPVAPSNSAVDLRMKFLKEKLVKSFGEKRARELR